MNLLGKRCEKSKINGDIIIKHFTTMFLRRGVCEETYTDIFRCWHVDHTGLELFR